jgi:PPM family protein phosphatase
LTHAVTQSLGGTRHVIRPKPHFRNVSPKIGASIILCSDGPTDMIDDERLYNVLRDHKGLSASSLVTAALEAGGSDNVSVIVGTFSPGKAPGGPEITVVVAQQAIGFGACG